MHPLSDCKVWIYTNTILVIEYTRGTALFVTVLFQENIHISQMIRFLKTGKTGDGSLS